jgi:hypothetical protein
MSATVSLHQWIIEDSGREVGALEIHPCRAEDPRGRARAHTEECERIVQDKAAPNCLGRKRNGAAASNRPI